MALFMVSCRDPGLMERVTDEEAGQGGWYWNEQVGSFRPPGALYCRECGVSAKQIFEGFVPLKDVSVSNAASAADFVHRFDAFVVFFRYGNRFSRR